MVETKRRRLKSRLATLASADPRENREQLIEIIREFVPSDFGLHMRLVSGDRLRFTFPAVVGQREPVNAARELESAPALDVPWFPPNADPGELNTFVRPRAFYGDARYFDSELHKNIYRHLDVRSEVRALLFDRDEFIGWFGLQRRGAGNRFTARECELLSSAMPEIKSALTATNALEERLLGEDIAAVYTADGRVDHASASLVEWADGERQKHLRSRIRDADARKDCFRVPSTFFRSPSEKSCAVTFRNACHYTISASVCRKTTAEYADDLCEGKRSGYWECWGTGMCSQARHSQTVRVTPIQAPKQFGW